MVGVIVLVAVAEGLALGLTEVVIDKVGVWVPVSETVLVEVALIEAVGEAVTLAPMLELGDPVDVDVMVTEGVPVSLSVKVVVMLALWVAVAE